MKQDGFARSFHQIGNATEAYRLNYSTENMLPATIERNAHELLKNNKVSARLSELQDAVAKRHNITQDDIANALARIAFVDHPEHLRKARISDQLKALELLGRFLGYFRESERSGEPAIVISKVTYVLPGPMGPTSSMGPMGPMGPIPPELVSLPMIDGVAGDGDHDDDAAGL